MDKVESSNKMNASVALNVISKLVQEIEKKGLEDKLKAKECEQLKLLKEKCCAKNVILSLSAFHGIESLVERRILISSQTISMLISLLPSINQYAALASTVGKILLLQLQAEISQTGTYTCPYNMQIQHPLIIILKFCTEKSWFEIFTFLLQLIQMNEEIDVEHKLEFLRPIVRQVFWDPLWAGSKFQMKLFSVLVLQSHIKEYLHFTLEALLWHQLDVHYCMYLQQLFSHLLSQKHAEGKVAVRGLTPVLAEATKWLILNGHNPSVWLRTLRTCLDFDRASASTVLYILTEVIMETPYIYINMLIDVCKEIVLSTDCSKYVAHKFTAVVLNWFMNPSFMANPLYQTLEEIIDFVTGATKKWNDLTVAVNDNVYYQVFGKSKPEVKFVVDLILESSCWCEKKKPVADWVRNVCDSNERQMQLKLHSFLQGVILCERDNAVVNLCLDLLFKLTDPHPEISFSLLCLLFYKLGREPDPAMQKIFLFSLPKLALQKENLPLIVGIIESLKRGSPRIITPLVIQLYLSLWKFDRRTYSYLHAMLHDTPPTDFAWEVNVSRAMALRDVSRLAPHLHAKDLVGVLSRILNQCSGNVSGLPSAIAIEAVTELCKAYVIDVAGTWSAIQPKLRQDKRPRVIKSLCRFFGEIPHLNSWEEKYEDLMKDIVPMLWNYTFFKEQEVTRSALRALSHFPLENFPLRLFPEVYRDGIRLPKDPDKISKAPEDILSLPYVPPECWVQFLSRIDVEVLKEGGDLVIALIERELTSLPRGIFYFPPEKPEPVSYSYLPPKSISRALVEHLRTHPANPSRGPQYLAQILSILAHNYSKLLPPINWCFLQNLMPLGSNFQRHCLALLAKQGQTSTSAKSILDSYFNSTDWHSQNLEHILFVHTLLPLLCKSLSYHVFQNFLDVTILVTLRSTLDHDAPHFQTLLLSLTDTFNSKTVHVGQKTLIARQLEKVIAFIPPEHQAMRTYARCATEFPMKSIDQITSVKDVGHVTGDWLRRAFAVKCAIAKRSDIKEPLAWLNELIETAAHFPDEQDMIVESLWSVIRERRDCDYRVSLQDLSWKIQASITAPTGTDSGEVTVFLMDAFVTATIILSGHDCLFASATDLSVSKARRLDAFPQALFALLSLPHWSDMSPKMGSWLQKVLKWKALPQERAKAFIQALFTLNQSTALATANETACFYGLYPSPFFLRKEGMENKTNY